MSDVLPIPRRRGRPPKSAASYMPPMQQTSSSLSHGSNYTPPSSLSRGSPASVSRGSAASVLSAPVHRSTNSLFPPRTADLVTPKTVVKGNIMYKTMETGEVIASVIKNGPQSASAVAAAASAAAMGTFNPLTRK